MHDHSNSFQDHEDSINQNTNDNANKKWVIHLSSTPLTSTQDVLLAHGPDFVMAHLNPPYLECIAAIECVWQSLNTNEAEELRADIYRALRHSQPSKPNLRKEELKALTQLKTDKEHVVLTGDKGVALVVMDRQEYIKKPGPF